MLIKLEDEKSFVKNIKNNSLINQDIASLSDYKSKKSIVSQINGLSNEINNIKSDISEIKSLIVKLVKSNSAEK